MKKIILYATGKDQTGIISDISEKINLLNGNIETSKMIKLEEFFNVLALISIDENKIKKLEESLKNIEGLDITLSKVLTNSKTNDKDVYKFSLKGADSEGIVYTFTNYLQNQKINIKDLETEIKNAPVTGYPLFFLTATILIPNKLSSENIRKKLIELSHKHNVAIKLEAIDY